MAAFERLNIVRRQPRKESAGWFGPYDANVLGGLLVGTGMALTGACPGTVLVQLSTGIKSGVPTALGGLLGGILFARFGSALKKGLSASTPPLDAKSHTIYTKFDINPDHVLMAYEILCLALIGGFSAFGLNRSAPLLHPLVGGALIGGAQASSLLFSSQEIPLVSQQRMKRQVASYGISSELESRGAALRQRRWRSLSAYWSAASPCHKRCLNLQNKRWISQGFARFLVVVRWSLGPDLLADVRQVMELVGCRRFRFQASSQLSRCLGVGS